jgi:NurA-like 5'-3' nuclease
MIVTILLIVVGLLFLALLASGYGNLNILKKNEVLEEYIINVRMRIRDTLTLMKLIDSKQIFEKDDEVGASFESLLQAVIELDHIVRDADNEETAQEAVPQIYQ